MSVTSPSSTTTCSPAARWSSMHPCLQLPPKTTMFPRQLSRRLTTLRACRCRAKQRHLRVAPRLTTASVTQTRPRARTAALCGLTSRSAPRPRESSCRALSEQLAPKAGLRSLRACPMKNQSHIRMRLVRRRFKARPQIQKLASHRPNLTRATGME